MSPLFKAERNELYADSALITVLSHVSTPLSDDMKASLTTFSAPLTTASAALQLPRLLIFSPTLPSRLSSSPLNVLLSDDAVPRASFIFCISRWLSPIFAFRFSIDDDSCLPNGLFFSASLSWLYIRCKRSKADWYSRICPRLVCALASILPIIATKSLISPLALLSDFSSPSLAWTNLFRLSRAFFNPASHLSVTATSSILLTAIFILLFSCSCSAALLRQLLPLSSLTLALLPTSPRSQAVRKNSCPGYFRVFPMYSGCPFRSTTDAQPHGTSCRC